MTPKTTSTAGRFFEHLPSTKHTTYTVSDYEDGILEARLGRLLDLIGHSDTIVLVDIGVDALYSTTGHDGAKAPPDQDLRVARVGNSIGQAKGIKVLTAEIAVGVDSPPNAQEVLLSGKAKCIALNQEQTTQVLTQYYGWSLNGTRGDLYGKTPYAWQAALRRQFGLMALPIPLRDVLNPTNPWNNFVVVWPSMADIYVMETADHLRSIDSSH